MEQITHDKNIETIVDNILSNQSFSESCKSIFDEIYKDKKLDQNDIPDLIKLIFILYKNKNKLRISKKNIKRVFIFLIFKLIEQNVSEENNQIEKYELIKLIEPGIDLILFSLDDFIFRCCCKSKNSETKDYIIKKIKAHDTQLVKTVSFESLELKKNNP